MFLVKRIIGIMRAENSKTTFKFVIFTDVNPFSEHGVGLYTGHTAIAALIGIVV